MNWVTLEYSKGQVDAAGRLLASSGASPEELNQALDILNNWRAAHSFPLNTIQVGVRRRARNVDEHALIAQRLKRVSSILQKLQRFPQMQLSRMQEYRWMSRGAEHVCRGSKGKIGVREESSAARICKSERLHCRTKAIRLSRYSLDLQI
jgi:hypothetical protein